MGQEVITAVPNKPTTVDIVRLQTKRMTQEHLEKKSGEGNVQGRHQVQLEEDGAQHRPGWS